MTPAADQAARVRAFISQAKGDPRRTLVALDALPRSWMIAGLAGVAYAVMTRPVSLVELAISLGGVMLASQALNAIADGVIHLVGAAKSWEQIGPLFHAAARTADPPSLMLGPAGGSGEPARADTPLLTARELYFRFRPHGPYVLERINLQIARGDRLLLEGPSGGGKSTLAALLAGLRSPESGLLLLWGYDRPSVGAEAWQRRAAIAPQFHENHIFSGTMAFNLLMGRRWPPTDPDLSEAGAVCRELGLGDLLDRMPSGLQQIVGEGGWRLSHGERSRIYIARALLQAADLVVMDESFAALDPENLRRSLKCVLNRADTVLVIAHP